MSSNGQRVLGVTVLTDFLLNEGVEGILDNIVGRAGANAVAVNPTVTAQSREGEGSFQPPADAGSSPRLFDRPLWGKYALWVRSGPSFVPRAELYEGVPYGPRKTNDLTQTHGKIVAEFIDAALARGLKVFLQVGAAQPTGLREEDRPRLPDGTLPDRMADTASLASLAVRDYNRAYVRDLLLEYPQITGIRIDWPEYPCYKFEEIFQDFSPHVEKWAREHGFDFDRVRRGVSELLNQLRGSVTNEALRQLCQPDRGVFLLARWLLHSRPVAEWLALKAALSLDIVRHWREILDEAGGGDKHLSAHAFMPPYTLLTGFDFAHAGQYAQSISPKLYTMHWSQMVEFWGRRLLADNPGLREDLLAQAISCLMDIVDAPTAKGLSDYGYPEPDEPHPIPDGPQQRKIQQVLDAVGDSAQVWPLVHGYGPLEDFERRFRIVAASNAHGVWLNRYGYLSDAKLDAIGRLWRQ